MFIKNGSERSLGIHNCDCAVTVMVFRVQERNCGFERKKLVLSSHRSHLKALKCNIYIYSLVHHRCLAYNRVQLYIQVSTDANPNGLFDPIVVGVRVVFATFDMLHSTRRLLL